MGWSVWWFGMLGGPAGLAVLTAAAFISLGVGIARYASGRSARAAFVLAAVLFAADVALAIAWVVFWGAVGLLTGGVR